MTTPGLVNPRERQSAPATKAFAEVTTCFGCGESNAADRRFCAQCGASLWLACPGCRAEHGASEQFCGSCGANLEQLRRERSAEYEAVLQQAEEMFQQYHYHKAVRILAPLAKQQDPRFRGFREQAVEWTRRLEAALQQAREDGERACATAHRLLEQHDHDAAVSILEAIPPVLRGDGVRELLRAAVERREEVRSLTEGVARAVKSGELDGLGIKLERLLRLQPKHETALRLAGQFRDRQIRAARAQLAASQYELALAALEAIPLSQSNEEVEKVSAQARELNWLKTDLELAAHADDALRAVAERLVKLRPEDAEATRRLAIIRKKAAEPPRDRRCAAPDWTPAQSRLLELPVDWLAFPKRITVEPEAMTSLQRFPGRFWVACGLALQGVERAAVEMNLASERSGGMLQRFAWGRKKATSAWGIDIGSTSLKAVRLVNDKAGVSLERAVVVEHTGDSGRIDDTSDRRAAMSAALRSFLERHPPGEDRVCLGLPGSNALGRFFRLPPLDEKRMADAVAYEARQQIPIALDELSWDFHAWPLTKAEADEEHAWRVVLQAVKSHHAQEMLHVAAEAGGKIDILSTNSLALHNLAVFELLGAGGSAAGPQNAVAMMDVGRQGTDLVISSHESLWFRSIGVGGEAATSSLIRNFKLTRDQAEQLKLAPTKARRMSQLYEAINPVLLHLSSEIQRSLELHARLFPEVKVGHLFGIGGGCALHGLMRRLRSGC